MQNVTWLSLLLLEELVPYLDKWLYVDDSFITFVDQENTSVGLRIVTSIQIEDWKLNNLVYNFLKKNGILVSCDFIYENGGYNFTFSYEEGE